MSNTVEVLDNILMRLDKQQNQYISLAGTESQPLYEAICIVRHALLKITDENIYNLNEQCPECARYDGHEKYCSEYKEPRMTATEVLDNISMRTTNSPFDKLVDRRLVHIKATLQRKGKEYATDDDRFHNFKAAGRKRNQTPEQALVGMVAKHEVSVDDLVKWAGTSPERITVKLIDEKIGDNINYLILLEGLLRERIGK